MASQNNVDDTHIFPVLMGIINERERKNKVIRRNNALQRRRNYFTKKKRECMIFFAMVLRYYVRQIPRRRWWARNRSASFWATISNDWTDDDWREHLRMCEESFDKLCRIIAPFIEKQDTNFRRAIPTRERLAITLYRIADTMTYRSLGNLFGIGKSTAWKIATDTCKCIVENLLSKYIRLPTNEEVQDEMDGFYDIAGFPQVVGKIYVN